MKSPARLFYDQILTLLEVKPTKSQREVIVKLVQFTVDEQQQLFVLKGYAGTGKTTLVSAFAKALRVINYSSVLLAPTGRAAKVIGNYAKKNAFTIHKKIFFYGNVEGKFTFTLKENKHKNTLFIVDEASMISNTRGIFTQDKSQSLLDSLISYVLSGTNCKLILIGDAAQLPPVKAALSPALDIEYLTANYALETPNHTLTEVMRQHETSGILYNATQLRKQIALQLLDFKFNLSFTDIQNITDMYDLEEHFYKAFDERNLENSIVIVRSNKRANLYNQQIRLKIRGFEEIINVGDFVMVVKNNYYWIDDNTQAGFIANGDICEITRIYNIEQKYGFEFATVEIRMIDYPAMAPLEVIVILNTLTSEEPALNYEDYKSLFEQISMEYEEEQNKLKRNLLVKSNPYFAALQIKFAYAITCHKSQGGQWQNVFVEQPYLKDGVSSMYYRWLYTAITRASENLFLLGFSEEYFEVN